MNVIYVDKHDNPISAGSITNATENNIIVRIARIFIFNSNGELLIQKRSAIVNRSPNKWDHSASGHVDENETYIQAASRELKEEVGIDNVELREITKYYAETTIKKCFNTIFVGKYGGNVVIDNYEVSEYKWVSLTDLAKEMAKHPNSFTKGFTDALKIYQES